MRIIHIPPVKTPYSVLNQQMEMYLAHLVLERPILYSESRARPSYKIVDNSFNELQYAMNLDCLLEAVNIIRADEVILPDCIDSKQNIDLIKNSMRMIDCLGKYAKLKEIKKMAVLHADTWEEAIKTIEELDVKDNGVSTIGMPKGICALAPFNKGRVLLSKLVRFKSVHFLGSIGLKEIIGSDVSNVRSMDSGWYLTNELDPLADREDVYSEIPLKSTGIEPAILKERAERVNELVRRWCF